MGPEERGRGVVASSSGNHALALGYVSKRLGIDAVVVVPEGTPKVKVEAIKAFGLELKMCDSVYGG
jgi:threonine dehydratase